MRNNRWLAAAALAACVWLSACADDAQPTPPPPEVEVVTVRPQPIANVIELPGRVQDFAALVEDLSRTLDKFKVPAKEQGELIAILVPGGSDHGHRVVRSGADGPVARRDRRRHAGDSPDAAGNLFDIDAGVAEGDGHGRNSFGL